MTYISLYRKWRPQSLSELVGQEHVAKTLANAIKTNRIAHAYLFAGPRGTGKTSTAKILAKAINCDRGPTVDPCQKCENCLGITGGSSLDVLEIDAASNRGIDEIRDLREKAKFAPTGAPKKVYIIDEVHMLTPEAFNALLRLLEEPPSHVIFVLATTEPSKILPTIISRCQRFDFRRILFADLVNHLERIAAKEKIKCGRTAVEMIARQAQGGLRDALGLLDQLASYTDKNIAREDVADLLGLIGSERLFEAVDIIVGGSIAAVFPFSDRLANDGRDFRQFTKELIEHCRDLFILQNGGDAGLLTAISDDVDPLMKQAENLTAAKLRRLLDTLGRALMEMRTESDHKLIFEMAMIQVLAPESEIALDSVLERLDALENRGVDGRAAKSMPSGSGDRHVTETSVLKSSKKTDRNPPIPPAATETAAGEPEGEMTKRVIERFWPTVMAKIKQKSLPTHAILMECRPLEVRDGRLVIGIAHDWQQTLLEKKNNLSAIISSIKEITGSQLGIIFTSDESRAGEFATAETAAPAADDGESDGALKLLQEKFGAEVVGDLDK